MTGLLSLGTLGHQQNDRKAQGPNLQHEIVTLSLVVRDLSAFLLKSERSLSGAYGNPISLCHHRNNRQKLKNNNLVHII